MDNLEVKRIRESLGLTQQQLAKSCGVSVRSVQNWEAGSVVIPDSKRLLLQSLVRQKETPAMLSSPPTSSVVVGDNNSSVAAGVGCSVGSADVKAFLSEIAAQRGLTEEAQRQSAKSQEQIDRLLSIIEKSKGVQP